MNKKRFLVMPIVAVVVAMLGISVMAASPSTYFKVHNYNDDDVGTNFEGTAITTAPSLDLSSISGLEAEVKAANSNLKLSDFKYKVGYNVRCVNTEYSVGANNSHTVFITCSVAADEVAIIIHDGTDGIQYNVMKGAVSEVKIGGINNFSPFYVYVGSAATSPQTGDFAPAYIAMISVALISCGAIFAIRAKKATK